MDDGAGEGPFSSDVPPGEGDPAVHRDDEARSEIGEHGPDRSPADEWCERR
jgi:hypothetical protein